MVEDAIRSMVERHSCDVFATRYSLRLEWLTIEPSDAELMQYFLCVELMAVDEAATTPIQVHLAVCLTRLSEFPAVFDDALRVHLFERAMAVAPQRPWTVRMRRWAETARSVGRSPWGPTQH